MYMEIAKRLRGLQTLVLAIILVQSEDLFDIRQRSLFVLGRSARQRGIY